MVCNTIQSLSNSGRTKIMITFNFACIKDECVYHSVFRSWFLKMILLEPKNRAESSSQRWWNFWWFLKVIGFLFFRTCSLRWISEKVRFWRTRKNVHQSVTARANLQLLIEANFVFLANSDHNKMQIIQRTWKPAGLAARRRAGFALLHWRGGYWT